MERVGRCEELDGKVFLGLGSTLAIAIQLLIRTAYKVDFALAILLDRKRESSF